MNLQNGFKYGMTTSEEIQEADTVYMCFNVFVTRGITCWPDMGGTQAWFTCRSVLDAKVCDLLKPNPNITNTRGRVTVRCRNTVGR